MEVVCARCGINTPWEEQVGIRDENGEIEIVCIDCAEQIDKNTIDTIENK